LRQNFQLAKVNGVDNATSTESVTLFKLLSINTLDSCPQLALVINTLFADVKNVGSREVLVACFIGACSKRA
jgi:hypothetical protein